jgi:hypothetical protein
MTEKIKKTKGFSVRMTDWDYNQLDKIARFRGVPKNEVISEALYELARIKYEEGEKILKSIEAGSLKADDPKELEPFIKYAKANMNVFRELYEEYLHREHLNEQNSVDIDQADLSGLSEWSQSNG